MSFTSFLELCGAFVLGLFAGRILESAREGRRVNRLVGQPRPMWRIYRGYDWEGRKWSWTTPLFPDPWRAVAALRRRRETEPGTEWVLSLEDEEDLLSGRTLGTSGSGEAATDRGGRRHRDALDKDLGKSPELTMNWWFRMRRVPGGPILASSLGLLAFLLLYAVVYPPLRWWEWLAFMVLGGAAYPGDTSGFSVDQHLAARKFELKAILACLLFLAFVAVRRLL
jgi:hypothetical protein